VKVGERCERLLDEKIQAVPVKRVQADEMWGFVWKKEKRKKPQDGDITPSDGRAAFSLVLAKGKRGL